VLASATLVHADMITGSVDPNAIPPIQTIPIVISDPSSFSATTSSVFQLFLFDSSNTDVFPGSGGNSLSALPNTWSPGNYFLDITLFNTNPILNGANVLTGWQTLGGVVGETPIPYSIDVQGVGANVVPEPASMMLFSMGTLALLGYGWRRRWRR
jgi:hypothetical protein